jgi:hypothetical protein
MSGQKQIVCELATCVAFVSLPAATSPPAVEPMAEPVLAWRCHGGRLCGSPNTLAGIAP